MSTLTLTDVDLSLFEDFTVPCEHSEHTTDTAWHADGREHYLFSLEPCGCAAPGTIKVACHKWITLCRMLGANIRCLRCGEKHPFDRQYRLLGPVKGGLGSGA